MGDIEIEKAARPIGKWIAGIAVGIAIVSLGAFRTASPAGLKIGVIYLVVGALVAEIVLVYQFSRRGNGQPAILVLLAGWAFAAGGIGLDVTVTAIKTPDLRLENNPIARTLLGEGYSVPFVRSFGFVAETGVLFFSILAWLAFLRHRDNLVALAWALQPQSGKEFLSAALRGVVKPKPLISREGFALPKFNSYRFTCFLLAAWIGGQAGRWYLGLEWLGVVPHSPPLAATVTALGVLFFYGWFWLQYRKGPPNASVTPAEIKADAACV